MSEQKPQSSAPQLLRTMGLFSLVVYGVGDMVGSGIYGTVGKAAGTLGNAVWLAFVVSMVAAVLTGFSYACLASRYPRVAGAAYVTQRAYGFSYLSYLIGLMVTSTGLTSMATSTTVFSNTLHAMFFSPPVDNSNRMWWIVIVLGLLGFLTAVNLWGLRESMWTNLACTAVEVGGLLFIIAIGMRYWGGVNYLETPQATFGAENQIIDHGLTVSMLLSGAVLTFFSFIGFEDIMNVAEEVKDPTRTMPLGIVFALSIATLLYLSVAVTAVSVVDYRDLAKAPAPLSAIVAVAAPWMNSRVFDFVTLFAVSNTVLINYIMGSRLLYGMARHGFLPAVLGRVNESRRTPHVAILAIFAVVLLLIFAGQAGVAAQAKAAEPAIAGVKPPPLLDPVTELASATSLLLLSSFMVVNSALVVLKLRRNESRGSFEVPVFVPVLGILVNGALIVARIMTAAPDAGRRAIAIAGGLVLAITILYVLVRPKHVTEETLAAIEDDLPIE